MTNWLTLLETLEHIIGSTPLLLIVFVIFFMLKGWMLCTLIKKKIHVRSTYFTTIPLIIILATSMLDNSAWIFRLVRILWLPNIDFRIYLFWLRISWGGLIIHYQALTLFIANLISKNKKLAPYQLLFITISSSFFLFFWGIAFFNFNCESAEARPAFEWIVLNIASSYYLLPMSIINVYLTIRQSRIIPMPRILQKQLTLLLKFIVIPYLAFDFIQLFPSHFSPTSVTSSYTFLTLSNIFLTAGFYLCAKKIMGIRFLNLENHVTSAEQNRFMDGLKHALEQLSYVTNPHELKHISQSFFKEAFAVPLGKIALYTRKRAGQADTITAVEQTAETGLPLVESFLSVADAPTLNYMKQSRILIYDEIAFSNFYEETAERLTLLSFLNIINADIFLPIYEKGDLLAYIIIDRHARPDNFYSNVERDEMLIFSNYVSSIINLLQNKNLDGLIFQAKNLQEELYKKHQEINQYKESIRSFLRTNRQDHIGVIFYKNRRFTFGNQAAKELIAININTYEGHPLTKTIKSLAQQVESYATPLSVLAKGANNTQLVLSAVPHLEHNQVIIMVYLPEISDILKRQIDLLHDPSEWDYLLYLETTQSGKLINQLIPATGPSLLKFKIELLKLALSKKALLLDLPNEDLLPTVELLHHINLREKLHVLNLQGPTENYEVAVKLFGISTMFNARNQEVPLLHSLNNVGTLFIQNIHFLDGETQEYLAEFIKYGFYRTFKTNQKMAASVRIICSSHQDLYTLVQENKFSTALFNELKRTTVAMPSLITLPEEELKNLADGYSEQALHGDSLKHLLALTQQDKNKINSTRPTSLHDLKHKVQGMLMHKSKKAGAVEEPFFDTTYYTTDPDLVQAARLGKQALKDKNTMILLWKKLKSQNKIAHFLGVNRSSVNRRCKEYNLE
jgi:hypothetical protein